MPHLESDNKLPLGLHSLTYERLSTVKFSNTDILKIIENLDPNTAPGDEKRLAFGCYQSVKYQYVDQWGSFLMIVWRMVCFHLNGRKET